MDAQTISSSSIIRCFTKSIRQASSTIAVSNAVDSATKPVRLDWNCLGKSVKTSSNPRLILNKISGSAAPGEILALMGPSGCGKTSLLNLLSGRNNFDEGTLSINGVVATSSSFKKLKSQTAFVKQSDVFFEQLTVNDQLMFTALLRLPSSYSLDRKTLEVHLIIEKLSLHKCANSRIALLSGGEKKRVNIATELLTNPSVIILDEPTSGLDSASAVSLVKMLHDLASRENKTILTSIHQPSSATFQSFDKLLMLVNGCVVFHGTPSHSLSFLNQNGFYCPDGYNVSDYWMELLVSNTKVHEDNDESDCEEREHSNLKEEDVETKNQLVPEQLKCKDIAEIDLESQETQDITTNEQQGEKLSSSHKSSEISHSKQFESGNGASAFQLNKIIDEERREQLSSSHKSSDISHSKQIGSGNGASVFRKSLSKWRFSLTDSLISTLTRSNSISMQSPKDIAKCFNSMSETKLYPESIDIQSALECNTPRSKLISAWETYEEDKSGKTDDSHPIFVKKVSLAFEIEEAERVCSEKKYATDWWTQFCVLSRRSLKISRDQVSSHVNNMRIIGMAFVVSILWFQLQNTEESTNNRASYFFFALNYWILGTIFDSMGKFPIERNIIFKERAAGSYHLSAYFLAKTVTEIPTRIVGPFLYMSISYWLATPNNKFLVFLSSTGCIMIGLFTGESIGLFIGAYILDITRATNVTIFTSLLLMLVGGFYIKVLPSFCSWLAYLSPFRYAYHALLMLVFDEDIPCDGSGILSTLCGGAAEGIAKRDDVLEFLQVKGSVGFNITMLFIISVVFRVLAFYALRSQKIEDRM